MAWLSGSLTSPRDAGGPRAGGSRLQMPNWMRVAVPGGEAIAPVGDVSIAIAGGATATIPGGVYATLSGSPALATTTTHYVTYVTTAAPSVLLACKQESWAAIYSAADAVGIGWHTDHYDMRLPAKPNPARRRTMLSLHGGTGSIYGSWPQDNVPPPSGWEQPGFDDSSWVVPVVASRDLPLPLYATTAYFTTVSPLDDYEQAVGRFRFDWSGAVPVRASDVIFGLKCDDAVAGFYINGHPLFVPVFPANTLLDIRYQDVYHRYDFDQTEYRTIALPDLAWLNTSAGASNLIAIWSVNLHPSHSWQAWGINTIVGADAQP